MNNIILDTELVKRLSEIVLFSPMPEVSYQIQKGRELAYFNNEKFPTIPQKAFLANRAQFSLNCRYEEQRDEKS